jgi:L-alanine-DL-glutamate epimerase-like enolase superfamily enzyme
MQWLVRQESFPMAGVFRISRGERTEANVVTVTVTDDLGNQGRGECVPYARYGETTEGVIEAIAGARGVTDRLELSASLPPGAARNAMDCALWDLEAKSSGVPVWKRLGLAEAPGPRYTAFTLSLDTPERMAAAAKEHAYRPLLKLKLGGEGDLSRLEAVRLGAPRARIIVDANEAWTPEIYRSLAPILVELGVELVEQPFPAQADDALRDLERLLPVCADESCHTRDDLDRLQGKYDIVNIKLDKTGGLTEALALHATARAKGFGIMVGCMVGTSLAMAPAVLLAQDAEFVDLDGPLLLARDREPGLCFDAEGVHPPEPALWG